MAGRLGFNEIEQGNVAIIASELANNLVRHAKRGEILIQGDARRAQPRLEIVALDCGPGIENVAQSIEDGFSTAGTSGRGLGAIKRLSTYFDIHTTVGTGSAVVARLERKSDPQANSDRFEIGGISSCHPGETVCGDAWMSHQQGDLLSVMVADGLGHGPLAAQAAAAAMAIFEAHAQETPAAILELAHGALRSTRGAAAAVVQIDAARGELNFAGLGNVAALTVAEGKTKSMVSLNGTLGATPRKIQSFSYPWTPETTLLMSSDGLASHLRPDRYPGLLARDPTMVAGVLYRDFKRGRDDATLVVARERREVTS